MKARRRNCVVARLEGTWCRLSEHIGWSSSLWPTLHYLPITPSLRSQIIIRILLFSFLEGIFWLIPGCWAERSWWFLDKQLRDYFPSAREKYFLLEVAGWLVPCGGRPGSHRTSGLSMPQTPTTERCATWDCGDHRTGDTGDTGVMSDVSHYSSLPTLYFIISHNLSLHKWKNWKNLYYISFLHLPRDCK